MERNIWTEEDFESMDWHDTKIYAISFGLQENEIVFDIDYILKWISPIKKEINFKFFVAPATLVFRNV